MTRDGQRPPWTTAQMACKHGPGQPRGAGPQTKGCRMDTFTVQVFPDRSTGRVGCMDGERGKR